LTVNCIFLALIYYIKAKNVQFTVNIIGVLFYWKQQFIKVSTLVDKCCLIEPIFASVDKRSIFFYQVSWVRVHL